MDHVTSSQPHNCEYCSKRLFELIGDNKHYLKLGYTFDYASNAARKGCLFFRWCFPQWEQATRKRNAKTKYIRISIDMSDFETAQVKVDGKLRAESRKGDPAARYIENRPVNYDPGSDKSFGEIRELLRSCRKVQALNLHPRAILPRRVIDVGAQASLSVPRIHVANGERGQYLCLSYCWGGQQPMTLTSANLDSWSKEDGFPAKNLPQSLQDAIIVTRKLEYRYLWVDALCIIQDDADDIDREIARMPAYYMGASFTILASRARSCGEGFLHHRDGGHSSEETFLLPVKLEELDERKASSTNNKALQTPVIGSIVIYATSPRRYLRDTFKEPTESRGWTLQEQLLSDNIVEYASDGGEAWYLRPTRTPLLSDSRSIKHAWDIHYGQMRRAKAVWISIVEEFSERSTTLRKDRVYGIGGIAQVYSEYLKGAYYAGMWESMFPLSLLWHIKAPAEIQPRSLEYPAPTWSWMSVHGAVTHQFSFNSDMRSMVTISAVKVNLVLDSAPYGGTKDSHIVIRGRPLRAVWTKRRSTLERVDASRWQSSSGRIITSIAIQDTAGSGQSIEEDPEVWMLPIMMWKWGRDTTDIRGLILRDTQKSGYCREGYFEYKSYSSEVHDQVLRDSPQKELAIY